MDNYLLCVSVKQGSILFEAVKLAKEFSSRDKNGELPVVKFEPVCASYRNGGYN